jgi:4-alpha-glucanotransferase
MFPERAAGILIPLFAMRSADDLGRGDIGGLLGAGQLAHAMGQRLIQLLPLDETPPGEASPYSASSVFAIDPLYISLRSLDGIDDAAVDAARAALVGNQLDLVRLRVVKEGLQDRAFTEFSARGRESERLAFAEFAEANRWWLEDYALFRALKEKFAGAEWNHWPSALARREPRAIADASRALAASLERFRFRQFLAYRQWSEARAELSRCDVLLGGDLAFSPARDSAEVWARQRLFDFTRTVGAPPDAFSPSGQRWDLPMPDWAGMRADDFSFIRARVRRARALYDLIRIDHVVGLFRTYGFPLGPDGKGAFDPVEEAAQIAQGEELLKLIIAEAGPMRIVAEDLGVVPPFVRATMSQLGVPGYKIVRWERDWDAVGQPFRDPRSYPPAALVTTGTHDTDTLAEWWETLRDDERRHFVKDLRLDHAFGASSGVALKSQVLSVTRLAEPVLDAIIEAVYASPGQLAIIPLQDLFGWKDRVNVPGTVDGRNWRWRLPFDPFGAMNDPKLRARIDKLRTLAIQAGRF